MGLLSDARLEMKGIFRASLPISLSYLSQFSLVILAMHYVGKLGTDELAGASLAIMFCNCTGFAIVFGMANALDTLLFQAYGADPNSALLAVYLQRGTVILSLCCVPIMVIWTFGTESLLLAFGQDPHVAAIAGTYTKWNLLAILPMVLYEIIRKFLMCLDRVDTISLCALGVTAVSPVLYWLLVEVSGMGIGGAPLANSLVFTILVLICLAYIKWHGLDTQYGLYRIRHSHSTTTSSTLNPIFLGWGEFFALGIPSALSVIAEWGSFEVNGMSAGRLGVIELDTMAVAMNVLALYYMVPLGLGTGMSVRVGNAFGANDVRAARVGVAAGASMMVGVILFDWMTLAVLNARIPMFFTSNTEVHDLFVHILPALGAFHGLDSINCVCNSLTKSMGYPKYGLWFNILSYSIGLPTGWLLAFHTSLGLLGMWLGLVIGVACGLSGYIVFFLRTDWDSVALEASNRILQDAKGLEGENGDEVLSLSSDDEDMINEMSTIESVVPKEVNSIPVSVK
eukprot:PhF_6_TR12577/c0_g1_i9/m.19763/K03327/TC.MATE, SLC47A, norM, mdtK, dinF; multidrug resistance protein, MATE family